MDVSMMTAPLPSPSPRDLMGKVVLKGKTVWVAEILSKLGWASYNHLARLVT